MESIRMAYLLPQKNCMVQLKTLSKRKPTRKAGQMQIPNVLKLNPLKKITILSQHHMLLIVSKCIKIAMLYPKWTNLGK